MLLAGPCSISAQGFVNLNFEAATLATNGAPSFVSTSVGLPGWTALIGGVSQSSILYNNGTLGSSAVAILGNGNLINPVIEGGFSASLTAGDTGDAAISQTGLVPAGSASIFYKAYSQGNGLPNLLVTLNGQAITPFQLLTTPNYTLYGGDVSAFAGQTASLAFTAASKINPLGFEIFGLDSISFSSSSIPEPSGLALSALGGILFAWCAGKKSSP